MNTVWTEDLTEQEEQELIEKLAREVGKRELEMPAVLFLEMNKPLSNLAGNAMIAFGPFIAPFIGVDLAGRIGSLLRKPGGLERLIRTLETQRHEEANEESKS